MKDNKIRIGLRINKDCYDAFIFLQSINFNPAKLLREGGEKLVIETAEKMKRPKLIKIKLPF